MEILWEVLDFAAKGLVVLVVFAACILLAVGLLRRRRPAEGVVKLSHLNAHLERAADAIRSKVMVSKEHKRLLKERARALKHRPPARPRVYVLEFKGDIAASAVRHLREEVSALLLVAQAPDEVVVRLESSGGLVPHYGLAASQLARIKERGLRLTVCIDKMAASGGYLMACVADEILAAPFAIVGSIGVAAPVPNIHRLLKERGVDYDEMTAGEYKRTVSLFAEITDSGRSKYQEQIDATHILFKEFVKKYRPKLAVDTVSTGEYWHATRAVQLGLVNRLMTSDDYLMGRVEEAEVYTLSISMPRSLRERLATTISAAAGKLLIDLWTAAETARHP